MAEETRPEVLQAQSAAAAAPLAPSATPATPFQSELESPSPKRKLGLTIILSVLLAGLIVGGVVLFRHLRPDSSTPATAVKKDISLLRYGLNEGPVSAFYPAEETSNGVFFINEQIFEGLVQYQDSNKIVPLLATSWTNPDDSTWIFNLRPNVKFHSGRTMTAADVKYSLDSFKDKAFGGEFGSTIKAVAVMGDNQVKITTDGPDPILLHRLAFLFILDSHENKPGNAVAGTGPYIVKPGTNPAKDKQTNLVAFDGYHGGHVYTRELQVSTIEQEADAVKALKKHQLDLYYGLTDLTSIAGLAAANILTVGDEQLLVNLIALNTKTAPFNNLKLRQALDIGLDRTGLLKARQARGNPIHQFVVRAIPGYDPTLTVPLRDIAKAKQLVKQSGVSPAVFTLTYAGSAKASALEIQRQYAEIGVTVKLDPIDDFKVLGAKAFGGQTQAFLIGYSPDLLDATDTFSTLFQGKNYQNAQVDQLLMKANQTLDDSQRLRLLRQVAQILHDDVAAIPTGTRTEFYGRTNTDYNLHRDIPNSTIGVYFWKVYQQ